MNKNDKEENTYDRFFFFTYWLYIDVKNVRQKFKDTTITALNDQITRELQASYFYQAYVSKIYNAWITQSVGSCKLTWEKEYNAWISRKWLLSIFCYSKIKSKRTWCANYNSVTFTKFTKFTAVNNITRELQANQA